MATKKLPLPRFEIDRKKSKTGKYHYWGRFIAKNGREVWRTSEVYNSIAPIKNAIKLIKLNPYEPTIKIWE